MRRWIVVIVVIVVLFLPAILALAWPRHPPEGTPVDTTGMVVSSGSIA